MALAQTVTPNCAMPFFIDDRHLMKTATLKGDLKGKENREIPGVNAWGENPQGCHFVREIAIWGVN